MIKLKITEVKKLIQEYIKKKTSKKSEVSERVTENRKTYTKQIDQEIIIKQVAELCIQNLLITIEKETEKEYNEEVAKHNIYENNRKDRNNK